MVVRVGHRSLLLQPRRELFLFRLAVVLVLVAVLLFLHVLQELRRNLAEIHRVIATGGVVLRRWFPFTPQRPRRASNPRVETRAALERFAKPTFSVPHEVLGVGLVGLAVTQERLFLPDRRHTNSKSIDIRILRFYLLHASSKFGGMDVWFVRHHSPTFFNRWLNSRMLW